METFGVKRGLTAVEASYFLDMKPTQIVTEIIYSLLAEEGSLGSRNQTLTQTKGAASV